MAYVLRVSGFLLALVHQQVYSISGSKLKLRSNLLLLNLLHLGVQTEAQNYVYHRKMLILSLF